MADEKDIKKEIEIETPEEEPEIPAEETEAELEEASEGTETTSVSVPIRKRQQCLKPVRRV